MFSHNQQLESIDELEQNFLDIYNYQGELTKHLTNHRRNIAPRFLDGIGIKVSLPPSIDGLFYAVTILSIILAKKVLDLQNAYTNAIDMCNAKSDFINLIPSNKKWCEETRDKAEGFLFYRDIVLIISALLIATRLGVTYHGYRMKSKQHSLDEIFKIFEKENYQNIYNKIDKQLVELEDSFAQLMRFIFSPISKGKQNQ